ncbi:PA2169 family four-helix-bundle protein [Flavobacterium rhamnosiphilum]|uniref:PA2169 family four-helix-bundle protein n=1 Tax=Flavobacterium rhamnosiphilum TaxID=2541724 RepID=A0A4R5F827_9FLAO|nr:PA2169 family four-helix-bundle protein [Flavobacterium rhamnosiphilum]TDE44416.1 PA2169 family four-helix-bundle protein [Flavobacterium rhamnosiphilum]
MNKEKSIVVLNNLIEINNDRIQVYETATIITEESDLKDLFSEFQETSKIFKSELAEEVQKMGGIPVDVMKKNIFLVRLWINFKASLIDKDREDILNTLEYKEFVAIKNYKDTLAENFDHLTAELLIMLKSQQVLLTAHHDKVKKLGDLMLS